MITTFKDIELVLITSIKAMMELVVVTTIKDMWLVVITSIKAMELVVII